MNSETKQTQQQIHSPFKQRKKKIRAALKQIHVFVIHSLWCMYPQVISTPPVFKDAVAPYLGKIHTTSV